MEISSTVRIKSMENCFLISQLEWMKKYNTIKLRKHDVFGILIEIPSVSSCGGKKNRNRKISWYIRVSKFINELEGIIISYYRAAAVCASYIHNMHCVVQKGHRTRRIALRLALFTLIRNPASRTWYIKHLIIRVYRWHERLEINDSAAAVDVWVVISIYHIFIRRSRVYTTRVIINRNLGSMEV